MIQRSDIQPAVQAAIPIMLGYVAIGIPCGILEDSIGMNAILHKLEEMGAEVTRVAGIFNDR